MPVESEPSEREKKRKMEIIILNRHKRHAIIILLGVLRIDSQTQRERTISATGNGQWAMGNGYGDSDGVSLAQSALTAMVAYSK